MHTLDWALPRDVVISHREPPASSSLVQEVEWEGLRHELARTHLHPHRHSSRQASEERTRSTYMALAQQRWGVGTGAEYEQRWEGMRDDMSAERAPEFSPLPCLFTSMEVHAAVGCAGGQAARPTPPTPRLPHGRTHDGVPGREARPAPSHIHPLPTPDHSHPHPQPQPQPVSHTRPPPPAHTPR